MNIIIKKTLQVVIVCVILFLVFFLAGRISISDSVYLTYDKCCDGQPCTHIYYDADLDKCITAGQGTYDSWQGNQDYKK